MLEENNPVKIEIEDDKRDNDVGLETSDLEKGNDTFDCDRMDTYATVVATVTPYVSFPKSRFNIPDPPDGSRMFSSTRFYKLEGLITKHGFICWITRFFFSCSSSYGFVRLWTS